MPINLLIYILKPFIVRVNLLNARIKENNRSTERNAAFNPRPFAPNMEGCVFFKRPPIDSESNAVSAKRQRIAEQHRFVPIAHDSKIARTRSPQSSPNIPEIDAAQSLPNITEIDAAIKKNGLLFLPEL